VTNDRGSSLEPAGLLMTVRIDVQYWARFVEALSVLCPLILFDRRGVYLVAYN
jgi:hypothetical protein